MIRKSSQEEMQQLSEGAYRSADQVEGEERIAGQGKGEEPMQGAELWGRYRNFIQQGGVGKAASLWECDYEKENGR